MSQALAIDAHEQHADCMISTCSGGKIIKQLIFMPIIQLTALK
jgi:hypothetical protein